MVWISDQGTFHKSQQLGQQYEQSQYKNLSGEFAGQPGYHTAAYQYATDPGVGISLQKAIEGVQTDYGALFRGTAAREADIQTRSIQGALAGRGGGNLSLAGLGAQARAGTALGAETQAVQASQAAQDTLLNVLTQKYNVVSQILGVKSGLAQAQMAYHAARKAAEANITAAQWGAAGNWVGGASKA